MQIVFWTLLIVWYSKQKGKIRFRKLGVFLPSREMCEKVPTQVSPLERNTPSHWTHVEEESCYS